MATSAKFPAVLTAENMTASSSPDAVPGEEFEYVDLTGGFGEDVDLAAATKLYHPTMASATTCLPVPSLELR